MANVFVSPAIPSIAQHFHISSNEVQNVTIYFILGYLFGQIIYAPMIKGIGIKKTLTFGISIYFIGTIGCFASYLFDSFELLKYSRAITGIGSGSGFVAIYTTINNIWYEKEARKIT
jgi:DHA1 family bicyclomycin/chloramphenicol resistance-like MFS transporter